MENPSIPQKKPYKVKVEKGNTYFWCSCGLSLKQPYCDGSHKKEEKFKSIKFTADENKEIFYSTEKQFFKDQNVSNS